MLSHASLRPAKTWFFVALASLAVCSGASAQKYVQTNLVSDLPGVAKIKDPNLVNAWGIDFSSGSPVWIADNGSGLSTLYTGAGAILPLVVTIPPASGSAPTGLVFNGTGGFAGEGHDLFRGPFFFFLKPGGIHQRRNTSLEPSHAHRPLNQS